MYVLLHWMHNICIHRTVVINNKGSKFHQLFPLYMRNYCTVIQRPNKINILSHLCLYGMFHCHLVICRVSACIFYYVQHAPLIVFTLHSITCKCFKSLFAFLWCFTSLYWWVKVDEKNHQTDSNPMKKA